MNWYFPRGCTKIKPGFSFKYIDSRELMLMSSEKSKSLSSSGKARTSALPFIYALVESLLPLGSLELSDDEKSRVAKEVADFVQGQLDCLPLVPALLFSAGMAVFRTWVRIRYFKSFIRLPLATRGEVAADWAWGGSFFKRQLMRVVRSIALFSFYERPEVKSALLEGDDPVKQVQGR